MTFKKKSFGTQKKINPQANADTKQIVRLNPESDDLQIFFLSNYFYFMQKIII